MELKVKHMVLSAVFCLLSLFSFAQMSQHPPEPMMDHGEPHPVLCSEYEEGGVSPPVGLCLPIDGYIYPLLIAGIILGGYRMYNYDKTTKSSLF